MGKKKNKNNKPVRTNTTVTTKEDTENVISIEIPDNPEQKLSATVKQEEKPVDKETNPAQDKADKPQEDAQKTAPAPIKPVWSISRRKHYEEPENPDNVISIELPESEADKVNNFVPQVNSMNKQPLTEEQIAAKKRHTKAVISKTADIVLLVVLAIVGLLLLLPIVFAVVQSLKSTSELNNIPQSFFPKSFTLSSYVTLFTSTGDTGVPFWRFVFNSVFVVVAVVVLRNVVTVPAAYVLAKVRAPMIKVFNRVLEFSLVLTPALTYVINYVLMANTRLSDTYFAVILPFIASPVYLVLLRESMKRISDDEIYAAKLEGASHTTVLRKVVLPQVRPYIAGMTILSALEVGKLSGNVLTFGETLKTLPAYMENLSERGALGEMYALATFMLIPTIALFVIFRKNILGLMTTAMLKSEETL